MEQAQTEWGQKQAREEELAKQIKNKGGDNMPQNDGTGPAGQGRFCGRKRGFCKGNARRGFFQECFQQYTNSNLSTEEEKAFLRIQLNNIESRKDEIQKRLDELTKE